MGQYAAGDVILENYRIEKTIGRGAFGEVYLTTNIDLNGKRAIKVLLRDETGMGSSDFENYRTRFRQESQLMERLKSPHIVGVYDFREADGTLFLIMEYAAGGSLKNKLDKVREEGEILRVDEAVKIAIDIADGLSVLHAQDVIHRDLKPSNILFDEQGNAKVADLGLAQIHGGATTRTSLSNPPPHPGTPAYMSPEHGNSFTYLSPASDIYALGIILYEMLTGRAYKNLRSGTQVKELNPSVPDWLSDLIKRMLDNKPENRPWDGTEAAAELRKGFESTKSKTKSFKLKKTSTETTDSNKNGGDGSGNSDISKFLWGGLAVFLIIIAFISGQFFPDLVHSIGPGNPFTAGTPAPVLIYAPTSTKSPTMTAVPVLIYAPTSTKKSVNSIPLLIYAPTSTKKSVNSIPLLIYAPTSTASSK